MSENKYNTIIVGGGIAGLTSAAYLSRGGQKVLLIEKNKNAVDWLIHFPVTAFILMQE
jgi:flavin-dependent dehydrogenase